MKLDILFFVIIIKYEISSIPLLVKKSLNISYNSTKSDGYMKINNIIDTILFDNHHIFN